MDSKQSASTVSQSREMSSAPATCTGGVSWSEYQVTGPCVYRISIHNNITHSACLSSLPGQRLINGPVRDTFPDQAAPTVSARTGRLPDDRHQTTVVRRVLIRRRLIPPAVIKKSGVVMQPDTISCIPSARTCRRRPLSICKGRYDNSHPDSPVIQPAEDNYSSAWETLCHNTAHIQDGIFMCEISHAISCHPIKKTPPQIHINNMLNA